MDDLMVVGAAYLLGSVSFAVLMSKLFKLPDPRSYGSGNPGATNVLRSGKKTAALLTLLGDSAKGWLAVFLAQKFTPADAFQPELIALAAIAVFVGHIFPVFLRFQGGKGVATALGVLLALNPLLGLAALLTWLVVARLFKLSSLAALVAAASAPAFAWWLAEPAEYVAVSVVLALLLIWRHQKNIQNLLSGREGKIGQSAKPNTD